MKVMIAVPNKNPLQKVVFTRIERKKEEGWGIGGRRVSNEAGEDWSPGDPKVFFLLLLLLLLLLLGVKPWTDNRLDARNQA
jgi:hypothetical protein